MTIRFRRSKTFGLARVSAGRHGLSVRVGPRHLGISRSASGKLRIGASALGLSASTQPRTTKES